MPPRTTRRPPSSCCSLSRLSPWSCFSSDWMTSPPGAKPVAPPPPTLTGPCAAYFCLRTASCPTSPLSVLAWSAETGSRLCTGPSFFSSPYCVCLKLTFILRAHRRLDPSALPSDTNPVLAFVNGKSGGRSGAQLLYHLRSCLNASQVVDLSEGGPEAALEGFCGTAPLPRVKILGTSLRPAFLPFSVFAFF